MFSLKNLKVSLENFNCFFDCRLWLNTYANQDVLLNYIQKCGQQQIISKKSSEESLLYWKKHFQKNSLCSSFFADFEADNGIEISVIGKKQLLFTDKFLYAFVIIQNLNGNMF